MEMQQHVHDHDDIESDLESDLEIDLADKLLENIYTLIFQQKLHVIGLTAIDYFLTNPKKHTHVINVCPDNDKNVVKIAKKFKKALSFSFNIHIGYVKFDDCDDSYDDSESEDNDESEQVQIAKMTIIYKYSEGIAFHINIHHGPLTSLDIIFDFECISIKNSDTLVVTDLVEDYTMASAVKAIANKKFRLVMGHRPSGIPRNELGPIDSTNELMSYITISANTAELLNNGWKVSGPKLDKVFDPCLITLAPKANCSICSNAFRKYELKLTCCQQTICFSCAHEYIHSRACNSEIFCPFCKGDPFGFKTV